VFKKFVESVCLRGFEINVLSTMMPGRMLMMRCVFQDQVTQTAMYSNQFIHSLGLAGVLIPHLH
jgi:hypothetical protein